MLCEWMRNDIEDCSLSNCVQMSKLLMLLGCYLRAVQQKSQWLYQSEVQEFPSCAVNAVTLQTVLLCPHAGSCLVGSTTRLLSLCLAFSVLFLPFLWRGRREGLALPCTC